MGYMTILKFQSNVISLPRRRPHLAGGAGEDIGSYRRAEQTRVQNRPSVHGTDMRDVGKLLI